MLVGSALVGGVIELAMRRFWNAPRLIATVVTIGFAQIFVYLELKLPELDRRLAPACRTTSRRRTPASRLTIGGIIFSGDYFAIVVAAVRRLRRARRRSSATRAPASRSAPSAENADRARLLGVPVARLSTIVWILAGLCSGIAVFLQAPVTALPSGGSVSPLVLLYGLAAAVVARMESLPIAFARRHGRRRHPAGRVRRLEQAGRRRRADARRRARRAAVPAPADGPRVRHRRLVVPRAAGVPPDPGRAARPARGAAGAVGLGVLVRRSSCSPRRGSSAPAATRSSRRPRSRRWSPSHSSCCPDGPGRSRWASSASPAFGAAVAGGLATRHDLDFFLTIGAAAIAGALLAVLIGIPALRVPGSVPRGRHARARGDRAVRHPVPRALLLAAAADRRLRQPAEPLRPARRHVRHALLLRLPCVPRARLRCRRARCATAGRAAVHRAARQRARGPVLRRQRRSDASSPRSRSRARSRQSPARCSPTSRRSTPAASRWTPASPRSSTPWSAG